MPSVTFINRVYPPAEGATGQLLAELCPELVKRGWEVTVVTSAMGHAARSELLNGVRVECVGGGNVRKNSFWRRALGYLRLYPAFWWRVMRLPKSDLLITLTDPPLLVALGALLRGRTRHGVLHWAQDLYPEIAIEVGVLRSRFAGRLLKAVSTWGLHACRRVIVVGECMRQRVRGRGIAEQQIVTIPNWALGQGSGQATADEARAFRDAHQLGDAPIVMYSGNIGIAHSFASILDAAAQLDREQHPARFIFIGGGAQADRLRKDFADRGIRNALFLPFQPLDRLRQTLGSATLHIATMRSDMCGLVVPSKVYGILAAARPCIFIGPGECEAAQLIQRSGAGQVIAEGDTASLTTALKHWLGDPAQVERASTSARKLGPLIHVETAATAFHQLLSSCVTRPLPANSKR